MNGTPIKDSNRLEWIDAARGLAILGIFMVNVPAFNAPYFMYGGAAKYWNSEVSHAVQTIVDMFFQASFYTLFSFLFGFGMYMMKERLLEKGFGAGYTKVIFRRLVVLICFGLLHGLFVWHGDILFTYGMIGFLLFLFFDAKPRTMLATAIGILSGYAVIMGGLMYLSKDLLGQIQEDSIQQAMEHYTSGSLFDVWEQIQRDWLVSNGNGFAWFVLIATLLPMFLFGMYFCKKRLLHDIGTHNKTLRLIWLVSLFLFLTFKIGPYTFGNPEWFQFSMQDSIGGSASAIFYITSVTLMYQNGLGKQLLKPFTYVGRLSLSNYLLQSFICFFLFYPIGMGLYGQVPPLWSVVIVLIVYVIQVVLSFIWLRYFRFGPFEWLWRSITYGNKQRIRNDNREKGEVQREA
ncbi:DUF418 domain-containing protein [Pontibacillus salicampi]|uniref:DUF418 domain-containing protein n=1 Tax=Pontibacillus salicampi TaxID=1449801 RepID=A0ABV6LR03_9BACI